MSKEKNILRTQLRQKRNSLSEHEQTKASHQLYELFCELLIFADATHIAAYWPTDGEISPIPILNQALDLNIACYLPVLDPTCQQQIKFMQYNGNNLLHKNHYGTPEPTNASIIKIEKLSVILTPLVGFDRQGNRLGRGGGYYDKALSPLGKYNPKNRPKIIGLSHSIQEATNIPIDSWDWPLDAIATETEYIPITSQQHN